MIEKKIYIESIEPINIFGVNDAGLERIKSYFPKIRIIARGNQLKIEGEPSEIERFEERINILVDFFNKYNRLTINDIDNLLTDDIAEIEARHKTERDILIYGNNGKPIKARTPNQKRMVDEYEKNDLIFAVGPAGTGKTYIAIALAVRALKNKEVKRIILSRPAVEAGEKLGFLPGDLKEKLDPYLQALYDALFDMIPARKLEQMMQDRTIQIAPLAYMRGRTLSNAVVILDEAQNATVNQIKMFLTRMGENSKFIITGDITQIDLPRERVSGLVHAEKVLKDINGISFIKFNKKDVVRHPIVKKLIAAFDKYEQENNIINNNDNE